MAVGDAKIGTIGTNAEQLAASGEEWAVTGGAPGFARFKLADTDACLIGESASNAAVSIGGKAFITDAEGLINDNSSYVAAYSGVQTK